MDQGKNLSDHENRQRQAGRPDLSRRRFLGAAGAGAAVAASGGAAFAQGKPDPLITEIQDWNRYLGDSVAAHPYGMPSKFEKHVVRRDVEWLTASRESSINFTPIHALDGIITPNGICFERHHGGAPEIDPSKHRLMINGLVDKPLVFTLEDLKRFPGRTNKIYFLECAANGGMEWKGAQLNGCQFTHGMIHNVMYTGIPLKVLLDEAGVKTNGKWVMPEGADSAAMTRSIPIEKAMKDCMVVWAMNGEALRQEQGYPLRIVVPGWEGNMWVKWLRRIEAGDAFFKGLRDTLCHAVLQSEEVVGIAVELLRPHHLASPGVDQPGDHAQALRALLHRPFDQIARAQAPTYGLCALSRHVHLE
jgi:sulfane dehydrogenase subunit SoxC